ncbi:uncharacterized protein B0T15DRAFT_495633 [Chaetomium strumarium]|uniref:Uncharacterized protein n=1 Tax=Chaetomium strumarium TaxID=1170767 RepID=A0AAJ0GNN0_9PEZI|nr:hypothetical protein B0T15DRAFT_495633 [Chaetomium strumarium]
MSPSDATTAQLNPKLDNNKVIDLQQQLDEVKHQLKLAQQKKTSLAETRVQQDTRIRLLEEDIRRRSARVASLEVDKEELLARIRALEDEPRWLANVTAELQAVQSKVSAFFARMTDVEIPPPRSWFTAWAATLGDMRSPKIKGLELLCLHLYATLGVGWWGNEALALLDMLCNELKTATLVPVEGLVMVLGIGLQVAPSHREDILLVSLWQLAKMLEEVFPDKSRFGQLRKAIDSELLSSSPWCSRITQAITDGTIQGLCSSQDAQFYQTYGLGVLISPRKELYLALDIWGQRMWMFSDLEVEFTLSFSGGSSLTIPDFSRNPIRCETRSIPAFWFYGTAGTG